MQICTYFHIGFYHGTVVLLEPAVVLNGQCTEHCMRISSILIDVTVARQEPYHTKDNTHHALRLSRSGEHSAA